MAYKASCSSSKGVGVGLWEVLGSSPNGTKKGKKKRKKLHIEKENLATCQRFWIFLPF